MTKNDIEVLMGSVATVVRDFVDSAATKLSARIDAIAEKLAALPTPRDGKDADPVDYEKIHVAIEKRLDDRIAAIPAPKDAEPVDYAKIYGELSRQVREAVDALPKPKDGRDASPIDPDAIVASVLAKVPTPRDGKDAEPVNRDELLLLVRGVVAEMPVPQPGRDGRDADPEIIATLVAAGVERALPDAVRKAVDALMPELVAKAVAAIPVPQNGKDGISPDMDAIVAKAVAAIPVPKDGRDAEPISMESVAALVDKAVAALPPAKDGEPGVPGRDATIDPDQLRAMVDTAVSAAATHPHQVELMIGEAVTKAVAALPPAPQGPPGRDADDGAILAAVTEHMLRAFEALPKAQDGRPGRDADPVDLDAAVAKIMPLIRVPQDGVNGKDATPVDVDAVVAKVLPLIPTPRDGAPGKDAPAIDVDVVVAKVLPLIPVPVGIKGDPGKDADPVDVDAIVETVVKRLPVVENGKDGERGADGKSVTLDEIQPVLDAAVSRAELDIERRGMDAIQRAIERIEPPKDGANGRDGVSPDDFVFDYDGERALTLALVRDGQRIGEKTIELPIPIYRGVYKHGMRSKRSDVVTFAGSSWMAKRDTDSSPPSDDWQMMVKKGKDGKL